MDRRFAATLAASVLLFAVGVVAAVFLGGTGLFDQQPRVDAEVTGFNGTGATCTAAPDTTPTVDIGNTTRGSFLILRTNVTVPGPESRIDEATLAEQGVANYTLTYEGTTDDTACPDGEQAIVATQVSFQLPHRGGEPFGVTVRYRNRTLFELRNKPSELVVRDA